MKPIRNISIWFIFWIIFSGASGNQITDEQRLIYKTLKNYDADSRPVYNASDVVTIRFSFALIQIIDIDERNQILTMNIWLEQEWYDEQLLWNSSDYNNLDKMRLPCEKIWLPDIVLYNTADSFTVGFMPVKAMVKPNGEVFWSPPAKIRSSCEIDVTYFPFDDQICTLKFASWSYSGLQIDIQNKSSEIDLSNYIENGEWELISVTFEKRVEYYPCCPNEPYPSLVYKIHLRRKVLYYFSNIIIPCLWLSVLCLLGYWLPPDAGEKVSLGVTVLLAYSVFMLVIADSIPVTSEKIPLIGIYLTVTMGLTALSVILTILVLYLHHADEFSTPVPRGLYFFMTKYLSFEYSKRIQTLASIGSNNDNQRGDFSILNGRSVDDRAPICSLSCTCRHCYRTLINTQTYHRVTSKSTPLLKRGKQDLPIRNDQITEASSDLEYSENASGAFVWDKNSRKYIKKSKMLIKHPDICENKKKPLKYSPEEKNANLIKTMTAEISKLLNKQQEEDEETKKIIEEWQLMALIADRLFFYLFSLLTGFMSVLLLLVVPLMKNKGYLTNET